MFPKKNDDSGGVVPIPVFKSYLVKKKKKKKKLLKQSTKSAKDKTNENRILSHLLISPDSNKKSRKK